MMRCVFILLMIMGAAPAVWAADATTAALSKATQQVEEAIVKGEISLGPHLPGSGWTKNHMRQALALIEGEKSGDGGVIGLLKNAQAGLGEDAGAAVHAALLYLQAAAEHAKRAVSAKSIDETHAEATLATGLLVAARGNSDSKSPVTGALVFAARQR